MIALRLLSLWLLPLPLQGCFFACGIDEVGRVVSPGGRYVAVVFVRNCGATTDFNTNIAVVAAGDRIPNHGNIFIAEGGDAPRTAGGWFPVGVRWLGPERLQVTYAAGAEEFLRVDRFGGVTIDYRVDRRGHGSRLPDLSERKDGGSGASGGRAGTRAIIPT